MSAADEIARLAREDQVGAEARDLLNLARDALRNYVEGREWRPDAARLRDRIAAYDRDELADLLLTVCLRDAAIITGEDA